MNKKNADSFDFASEIETWIQPMNTLWRQMLGPHDTTANEVHCPDPTDKTEKTINDALKKLAGPDPDAMHTRIHACHLKKRRGHAGNVA